MHTLPALPYSYDALEPYIDAQTMEIHHTKHHQAYIDKLNTALENHPDLAEQTATNLISHLSDVSEEVRTAVQNHGGGHANHSLFWTIMAPDSGGEPTGDLATAINREFDSFSSFQDQFTTTASTHFGSGWAWLAVDADHALKILSTANQGSPLSAGLTPILALDVWEHAYYLKYQNKRPDYIAAFWNVVNWPEVANRYQQAISQ